MTPWKIKTFKEFLLLSLCSLFRASQFYCERGFFNNIFFPPNFEFSWLSLIDSNWTIFNSANPYGND